MFRLDEEKTTNLSYNSTGLSRPKDGRPLYVLLRGDQVALALVYGLFGTDSPKKEPHCEGAKSTKLPTGSGGTLRN